MRPQKIKKGRKGILHLPRILKHKTTYTQRIAISHNMFQVSDACDSGWSKLWGISFGHHHWHSSYRFVFRVKEGKLIIGYYAYIDGVSPQEDKSLKGQFKLDVKPKDILILRIDIRQWDLIAMQLEKEVQEIPGEGLYNLANRVKYSYTVFPKPKKHKYATWLRTELYPNLKCKQKQVTTFQFLK